MRKKVLIVESTSGACVEAFVAVPTPFAALKVLSPLFWAPYVLLLSFLLLWKTPLLETLFFLDSQLPMVYEAIILPFLCFIGMLPSCLPVAESSGKRFVVNIEKLGGAFLSWVGLLNIIASVFLLHSAGCSKWNFLLKFSIFEIYFEIWYWWRHNPMCFVGDDFGLIKSVWCDDDDTNPKIIAENIVLSVFSAL